MVGTAHPTRIKRDQRLPVPMAELTPESEIRFASVGASFADTADGVMVAAVESGGPAETAGVLVGDLVTAFAGKAATSARDLVRGFLPELIGRQVTLALRRAGRRLDCRVVLGELPLYLARYRQALRLFDEGLWERVIAELDEVLRLRPGDVWSHVLRADAYRVLGDVPRAEADYDSAVALAPEFVPARAGRGSLRLFVLGRPHDALLDLEVATRLAPGNATLLGYRGHAKLLSGDYRGAEGDFTAALALAPKDYSLRAGRAEALIHLRLWEEAAADLAQAAKLNPTDPTFPARRAEVLLEADRLDEAQADAEKAVRLQPDHRAARLAQVATLVSHKRFADALPIVDRLLAADPADARAYFLRSSIHHGLRNKEAAAIDYARYSELRDRLAAEVSPEPTAVVVVARFGDRRLADLLCTWLGQAEIEANQQPEAGGVLIQVEHTQAEAAADLAARVGRLQALLEEQPTAADKVPVRHAPCHSCGAPVLGRCSYCGDDVGEFLLERELDFLERPMAQLWCPNCKEPTVPTWPPQCSTCDAPLS